MDGSVIIRDYWYAENGAAATCEVPSIVSRSAPTSPSMSSSDEEEKRPKQPELSFITPNGYQRNSCGYCKSENGSWSHFLPLQALISLFLYVWVGVSYYASSKSMRVEEYQEMLDRGWRRLDPTTFKPRKDQRLTMNHWNNFVLGQSYIRSAARLCPKTREEKKLRKSKFDLLQRVHEVEYTNVKKLRDPKTKRSIEPAHRFEVNIESDSFSQAKYDLFLKYQMTIHKEPASRWNVPSFKRFLCTGIQRKTVKIGSKEQRLGSYHQCYRLDGFYIHSCPKMRYKANFQPQYVLDPESFTWSPFDNYKYELDRRPYMSLSHDSALEATTKAGGGVEGHPSDEEKDASNVKPPIGEEDMSLFDVNMPGVLTLQQLEEQVDLDHWKLLAHGVLVDMVDLVPWDNSDIRNPQSIKGIVAELAAVLGPMVVENSVVVLF
ncbi:arginine-tRNA protein transferase [Histoplasma capsulatum var. duboisii H88]|uniref:arginyltransferase n=1 Tax=Ajellomyces capsulatus (strain H88) TaxID=544711 RepID=F0UUJ1_AJEC8|nr:arginine-tRNA protein transferase [Histoplasma capsulatum var. duboisii H88]